MHIKILFGALLGTSFLFFFRYTIYANLCTQGVSQRRYEWIYPVGSKESGWNLPFDNVLGCYLFIYFTYLVFVTALCALWKF